MRRRLLVLSVVAAAVLAPAAGADTITVVTASAVTPGADALTVTRTFHKLPRDMYVLTSGAVVGVSAKTSCYPSATSSWPKVNRAYDDGPGRLSLSYDHQAVYCSVTATATGSSAKAERTFKIALRIVQ